MGARRTFGSIRKLPSDCYQARYGDEAGRRHTAPDTFATKGDASRWLADIEASSSRHVDRPRRRPSSVRRITPGHGSSTGLASNRALPTCTQVSCAATSSRASAIGRWLRSRQRSCEPGTRDSFDPVGRPRSFQRSATGSCTPSSRPLARTASSRATRVSSTAGDQSAARSVPSQRSLKCGPWPTRCPLGSGRSCSPQDSPVCALVSWRR